MGILKSLNREQREAVGLLQIGTFLEYFDLMLYVHMAVLLNELFFPKTDPHTAALVTAFAFCSTYVLRPFGALFFGYLGDHIGRKATVIITTTMMSISCALMANLPTYAQIGIAATYLVTLCRIVQGLSSMGEIVGAQVYVTEITKPPAQYPAVAFISIASAIGSILALGIASLVTHFGFNWRIAFWIGAGIAVVGSVARTKLRETPEFVDMKRKKQIEIEQQEKNEGRRINKFEIIKKRIRQEKIIKETFAFYFLVNCGWPVSFYLAYMYFNPLLKETYHYSSEDIIVHNFLISIAAFVFDSLWSLLCYTIHPLKILKGRGLTFLVFAVFLPFMITQTTHPFQLFGIQVFLLAFSLAQMPAAPVFIKSFPVFKRFTATSFTYAATRALMYIVTSFGVVYLTQGFGHYGLWILMLPITVGYLWGVRHFERLEGLRPDKPTPIKEERVLGKAA